MCKFYFSHFLHVSGLVWDAMSRTLASVTDSAYRAAEFTRRCYCAGIWADFQSVLKHLRSNALHTEAFQLIFTGYW